MLVFLYLQPDSKRFIKCYDLLQEKDIERFIRSNYESAKTLAEGFKNDKNVEVLKEEFPDFDKIKSHLSLFSFRISRHPFFLEA